MSQPAHSPFRQTLLTIVATIGILVTLLLLYSARMIVAVALIGIGFGVLVAPVIDQLNRRWKIPRGVGALLVALGAIGVFGIIAYAVIDVVATQVHALIEKGPAIVDSAKRGLERIFERQPWVMNQVSGLELGAAARTLLGGVMTGLQAGVLLLITGILVLTLGIYTGVNADSYRRGFLTVFPLITVRVPRQS